MFVDLGLAINNFMKYLLLVTLIVISFSATAGLNGLTHHSRANCINNESVSWDATRSWPLLVVSEHDVTGTLDWHEIRTGAELTETWRSAAVHWGEGAATGTKWLVRGWHYSLDEDGLCVLLEYTEASDCSIYDGWWDKDPPTHYYETRGS